ncbi:hypothetical protein LNP17_28030 [Klebsiella variicola subsp. variicola]|nr:hypothetical protein [Klebsiella variicola subsp. variicola]
MGAGLTVSEMMSPNPQVWESRQVPFTDGAY